MVDQTVTRFDRIDILVNSVIAVMKQSLKMSKKHEIVILGAGAVGCSIAYHLAKKGIRSTIIEKEAIGSRASGKAWAVISYPPCIKWLWPSFQIPSLECLTILLLIQR
jgi:heterodisulfide reductase subunit A-like polyferredoxin